jgi:16S rRNA (guanine966-N2)-methyltransferase
MRVVAGRWGGRKLEAPAGFGTRPTTDKVRLAVFNSLHSSGALEGAAVADLYAGSGAMGIEALSRGAASCVFVERDAGALRALRNNLAALGAGDEARVVTSDVMAWVPAMRNIDLVFADPPYEFEGWPALLALVHAPRVVAESGREVEAPDGWTQGRTRRYGRSVITVLERESGS